MRSAGSSSWLRTTLVADRRHGGERGLPHHVVLLEVAAWVFAHIFKAASGDPLHRSRRHGCCLHPLLTDPCRVCSGSGWCWPLMGIFADGGLPGGSGSGHWLMPLLFHPAAGDSVQPDSARERAW